MNWSHRAEYSRTHPNDPRPPLGGKYNEWVARADAWVPRRRMIDDCDFCREVGTHSPSHDASPYCESGSRPHCTCDRCF